jgi:regulatory factor X
MEHSFPEAAEAYSTQWIPHDHGHRELVAAPNQMTPEDLLLASQLQAGRDFSLDGPLNASMQSVAFNHHPSHSISRHSMSADSFAGNTSFADDSQMMDRDANDDNDSFVGAPGHSKSGSRSSANNEMEMRQLFTANKHRHLQDVAEELHGNERGPNSERTRQVFAMLWCAPRF